MALFAGFPPEENFCLSGAFGNPLRGSEDANPRRKRLTRKVAARIVQHAHLGCVPRNVFSECPDQKFVYHFRLVVRHAKVEALVERKQVAGRASIREFYWRHQLAAGGCTEGL